MNQEPRLYTFPEARQFVIARELAMAGYTDALEAFPEGERPFDPFAAASMAEKLRASGDFQVSIELTPGEAAVMEACFMVIAEGREDLATVDYEAISRALDA